MHAASGQNRTESGTRLQVLSQNKKKNKQNKNPKSFDAPLLHEALSGAEPRNGKDGLT